MTTIDAPTSAGSVTATGGSARSQVNELDERAWRPRIVASILVASLAFALPLCVAIATVQIAARIVPRPSGWGLTVVWLAGLGALATVAMRTTDRFSRRLLPLATLLRLSLVFPDRVPSRFSVALKSGSARALERALERHETDATFSTDEQAAALVVGLMRALSDHDRLTRGHSERVRAYSDLIANELALDQDDRNKLHWAALLHDVGKLDVPASILNKKGRLTADEWTTIRSHPAAAEKWLEPVREWLGEWARAATEHHERFDGDGYPVGLRGEQISLAGRIVAVADAFDVMTAQRSYKKPFPAAQARVEIANNAGTQFDPRVVRAFLDISVGRLKGVMGPLAWLSGMSGLLSAGSMSAGASAAVAAATTVTALAAPAAAQPAHVAKPRVAIVQSAASGNEGGSGIALARGGRNPPAGDPHNNPENPNRATVVVTSTSTSIPSNDDRKTRSTVPDPVTGVTPDPRSPRTTTTTSPSTPETKPPDTAPTTTTPPTSTSKNGPPIARNDSAANVLTGRVRVDVLANDSDPDGNLDKGTLKILEIVGVPYKSVQISSNEIDVRVNALQTGTLTITYQVCDTLGLCAQATLRVTFILG